MKKLNFLKSIKLKKSLKKQGVILAYLFGSVARGEAHLESDVDIAVLFDEKIKKDDYLRKEGRYEFFISDVVLRELMEAEKPKRGKLLDQVKGIVQLGSTIETEKLAKKYVNRKIISGNYLDDARHVAIATINNLDAVISWNYGHLVNINKIKGVNLVNETMGYKHIEIITPEEVIDYE